MGREEFFEEINEVLKNRKLSKNKISRLKIELCNKYKLKQIPTDFEVLLNARGGDLKYLKQLQTKPTRTISGVAVVAIMTMPLPCPHGKCSYCPGGVNSVFGDMPQSYTGKEPATMRGIRNKYDPYLQIFNRLEQYLILGHDIDKVELIVMGGTFPSFKNEYKEDFVKCSFKAFNDFSKIFFDGNRFKLFEFKDFFELPGEVGNVDRTKAIQNKMGKLKGKTSLEAEQRKNESSKVRCVAICIETRPDYCKEKHINEMLRFGTTRVELGVQSLDNKVLRKIKRGHGVEESIRATQLLKDSLLKVGYHMMPGLPLTTLEQDLEMLKELFSNPDFRPDALKIYPCMVMPGTELYEDYKKGKYKPITTEDAAELIIKFKRFVPKYCRIMRVQRDIPSYLAEAGVDMTNLRQYVHNMMEKRGVKCECIRCREPRSKLIGLKDVKIVEESYEASNGTEVFISAEDTKQDVLIGFCRLRIPYKPFSKEITNRSAGIRELHVYGSAVPLGEKGIIQHRGFGKRLLQKAEEIAKERYDKNKMLIISGIGAREYYRKLGYEKQDVYMVKRL
ncbi:hypothetical protein A3K72_01580 [Candidatus Woesearchaeota archaeon RBG_13_36_6]|nr:MAG: hypothetical protein A3K72_01580 [Candidatus Woesearchaeota archaeon RBG_13_36_6]